MGGQSKQMINYDILCKRTKKTNFMQRLLSIFSKFIIGVWKAFQRVNFDILRLFENTLIVKNGLHQIFRASLQNGISEK